RIQNPVGLATCRRAADTRFLVLSVRAVPCSPPFALPLRTRSARSSHGLLLLEPRQIGFPYDPLASEGEPTQTPFNQPSPDQHGIPTQPTGHLFDAQKTILPHRCVNRTIHRKSRSSVVRPTPPTR